MSRFKAPREKPDIAIKCDVTGRYIQDQEVSATFHCGIPKKGGYRVVNLNLSQNVADAIIKFLKDNYKCYPDTW